MTEPNLFLIYVDKLTPKELKVLDFRDSALHMISHYFLVFQGSSVLLRTPPASAVWLYDALPWTGNTMWTGKKPGLGYL